MKLGLLIQILIISLLTIISGQANGDLTSKEINDLSEEASRFFREAGLSMQTSPSQARQLYDQVILRYQRIIEQAGIANGYLFYNIANAYLLKGDIGRAILNYRRAERLMPHNADLKKNLDFARRRRLDQVPVKTEKRVLHTLFFWHYDLSTQIKFLLVSCLWALACIFGSIWFWRQRGRFTLGVIAVTLLMVLSLSSSLAVDIYAVHAHQQGVIIADTVIARQGDGVNYPESFKEPLHSGTEFDLLEKRPEWLRIELNNGDQAWVPIHAVDII
ncbi:hypothetical protein ACFL02_07415 [Planctomycetota bacterium]